jgi:rubrerythrin
MLRSKATNACSHRCAARLGEDFFHEGGRQVTIYNLSAAFVLWNAASMRRKNSLIRAHPLLVLVFSLRKIFTRRFAQRRLDGVSQMATTHRNGARQSWSSRALQRKKQMAVGDEWLKDFLSEMLAVEKGGVKLYEKALSELEHSEFEQKLTDFLRQTERHVELCTEMLEAAAGDANYQSPGAEAVDHKAEGLLSTEVPAELTDSNNIENLVLAETKDHWNWEMLALVAPRIGDPELKRMASKAIREVRKQEQVHVNWNQQTLTKLAMEIATQAPERETAEEAESMEKQGLKPGE